MNKIFSFDDVKIFGESCKGSVRLTQSFELEVSRSDCEGCILVSSVARYSGDASPNIAFSLWVSGDDRPVYRSYNYRIGASGEFTMQQWRVPPMFRPDMKARISVNIPMGTVLEISDFGGVPESYIKDWNGIGPRHNAHLGFYGIAPNNTMSAFELAARCGFPACIVVPKVTADGVLVCIHDDTINATARDENGLPPSESVNVSDYTYEQLSRWEYGSYKHSIYKGVPLPRLEDFFRLCAKTGMRPMFSTHPALSLDVWGQVRQMLIKYGLLKKFHIKSFGLSILKTAYSVFGDTIDGYTYDLSEWDDSRIDEMLGIGIDMEKCRVGIELKSSKYTAQIGERIISTGMFAAAWNIPRSTTTEDFERWFSYGVTEFTEDYHCSMGLNW